jgi:hypothetical protein
VVRNLDFIGDNPYETEADREETLDLLCKIPKPFYFNYMSLTYFPGVELTEWALRDGLIGPNDVEDVAQKGYHLWGGHLMSERSPENLKWDVAYTMAAHGVPKAAILRLIRSRFFIPNIQRFAAAMRQLVAAARWKRRTHDRLIGRENLLQMYAENTVRDFSGGSASVVHPNFGKEPFGSAPVAVEGAA